MEVFANGANGVDDADAKGLESIPSATNEPIKQRMMDGEETEGGRIYRKLGYANSPSVVARCWYDV